MEIRLATLNDVDAICLLYNEHFAYSANLQPAYYKAHKESGEYPKSTIESDKSGIFVAIENNKMVGFVHVREAQTPPYGPVVPHNFADVVDLIITEKYRKKGIGTMLMDSAKQWARQRNLDYMELFVLSDNEGGFKFYERNDFITVHHTMRCPL